MKKKTILMAVALFLASQGIKAQVVEDEGYDDENEITVTDNQGDEEVIEFPEAMAFELDSLLNHYMSKAYLTEDNDCRMKDVNPVFEKEVYIERLKRIPSVIELPYNDVVQKFIDRYSGRLRHSVSYMLGASNFYMPIRRSIGDLRTAPRTEIPTCHRVGSQSKGGVESGCHRTMAVYAHHRQTIWTQRQLARR